ncbi:hypothetical protein K1719_026787 [Acacia pycnantha]|nr:hypothetical protein K1719_026787 [Acacia pycnantha]
MLVAPSSKISSCVYFSSELLEMSAQALMSSETKLMQQKQGIVTILNSDSEKNRAFSSFSCSSLRRTLSADMSSKKWLSQNGFVSPMMKKAVSSQKLSHSDAADSCYSSSESESSDDCEERRKDLEDETIWSAIQKTKTEGVMRSPELLTSGAPFSLSKKSLEICTESLGSETGSDGFSSYPSSERGETEEDKDGEEEETEKEILQEHHEPEEDFVVPKFNYSATSKKSGPRSFPPPLSSLTRQDGPSVHMRSRRENGRLVLEAVSLPSQNNFCARRQDGRLLLTFNDLATYEEEEEEYDVDVEEMEGDFEEYEKEEEEDDDEETEKDVIDKSETEQQAPILSSRDDKIAGSGRENGDYLVHNGRSCKESRRSFLFWVPHCIATSS